MITMFGVIEAVLGLAILLATIAVFRGPTMANRVVAIDLLAVLAVGFMAVEAVWTSQYSLVDVAIGIGIVAFVGTASFALLILRDPGGGDVD
ncbi:MAG: cation:proton antiporter [Deltaproteobacteria bacterium]|nr:cation:proton antiporter [Deltaproteobacteria bacterium]